MLTVVCDELHTISITFWVISGRFRAEEPRWVAGISSQLSTWTSEVLEVPYFQRRVLMYHSRISNEGA